MKSYRVFVGCILASLCLLCGGARAQVVTEFSTGITAGAGPRGITTGPDGNLWFTERTGSRIARITPLGVVLNEYSTLTPNSSPVGIAAGPDGNLWFAEVNGRQIGRITPSGVVTEFSAGISANALVYGITAGPDGNLWFTEESGGRIGRITPLGVVTEFSTGITPGLGTHGIAAGPDGNLWFTEVGGSDRIGRITPLGVITEFSTGITPGAFPEGIAAGPDGNLWFTEFSGNRIGRITPSGVVTEFSTGITAGGGPFGIAAGPDGNVWFTEFNSDRIGRITPSGVITEFSAGITAGAGPVGITTGPDGNVWFAEQSGNRIGRITVPHPALLGAVSSKVHGAAGTFDLPLSIVATNPTTEPRQSSTATIVMTFDSTIVSANVAVTEGTATAGAPTFSGNDVIVPLTGVTDRQYVTISATNVSSAASSGGSGFRAGRIPGRRRKSEPGGKPGRSRPGQRPTSAAGDGGELPEGREHERHGDYRRQRNHQRYPRGPAPAGAWPARLSLPVTASRGYGYAEVTAGGVRLEEIDPGTMASRRCPGLFLVGEILDVDGRIGGFNFQWAWSTAWVAAGGLVRACAERAAETAGETGVLGSTAGE